MSENVGENQVPKTEEGNFWFHGCLLVRLLFLFTCGRRPTGHRVIPVVVVVVGVGAETTFKPMYDV